jgi:hypothetical protein
VSRHDIIIRKSGAEPIRLKFPTVDSVRVNLDTFADAVSGAAPYPISPGEIAAVTNTFIAIAEAVQTGVAAQEV